MLWRPDSMGDEVVTTRLGHYALAPLPLSGSPEWRAVPEEAQLFVAQDTCSSFAPPARHRLFIGAADPIAGLHACAHLVHDHEEDNDTCCEDFDAEVDGW